MANRLRKALFAVHVYLATVVGVFMSIFGVTESILAFSPELDRVFHRNDVIAASGQKPLSIAGLNDKVSNLAGESQLHRLDDVG